MANGGLGQVTATIGQARGEFSCSGGVCIPGPGIVGVFAGLQRSLNVLSAVAGAPALKVNVDDKIGPKTLAAAQQALTLFFPQQPIPQDANTLAQQARATAEMFAARANTKPNFTAASSTPAPTKSNLPVPLPPVPDAPNLKKPGVHWGWWVAGAVLIGGAAWFGWKSFKGESAFAGPDADDDEFDYKPAVEDYIDV